MPTIFVTGDLFANRYGVQAFAHGCNCHDSMGAGIVTTFRAQYPAMYEAYRARCKAEPHQFNLGDSFLWKDSTLPWVFNLGTQEQYWRDRATYEAIEMVLRAMRHQANVKGIQSIAIPHIGTGYGASRGARCV
ncbi:MAG: Appr-1-p processing protein [Chloroflexi bacterium AL-W]|nr:Appr-1-p processing protein [Chloroflexi bacterium AL-N1]NOK70016.1 Appr-1-p processing protein [Chloroflexi bacterium AL-N10]NOK77972.1 Appr-1-p processing protein [Chloroflexi bacterium AL-N5]NOK84981.1 Appr-1-p processing protein [Chloroflexi bacterium AL-W]NOK91960.1 Appr-1-p processing protein [Chloroflexi bacterium AL-N15]